MTHGLTVFIPLYNEEAVLQQNVVALLSFLDTLNLPYEIVLGSNGSTDRTPEIGNELANIYPRVKFFHLSRRGPGLAFAEALPRAVYTNLLCLDADLSTDLDFVPRAVSALRDHDAVVGSKQTGRQKRPLVRVIASELFIACTNMLLRMPYRDYSIGAKAYRTEAILPFVHKVDRHTFYTQELLYQLRRRGKKIVEIPVACEDLRESRFNLFHEGFYRYTKLFGLWLRSLRE
ncbi:MAG: glycosyltransferase family 2 protein [Deltaproteobacteria bacterium]|nr:glycosyltransferase family 2 protein [Deltaproteobacteria bacterium]